MGGWVDVGVESVQVSFSLVWVVLGVDGGFFPARNAK